VGELATSIYDQLIWDDDSTIVRFRFGTFDQVDGSANCDGDIKEESYVLVAQHGETMHLPVN
jgi:hypothetical protein